MMKCQIHVDNRESDKFISLLQQTITSNEIIITTLDIGDIHFVLDGESILIIERKEINDLASSLNGGRYHEQKARLKRAKYQVIYLIEGQYKNINFHFHKVFDYEKFKGCIINTMVRDGMPVYHTKSMEETMEFLVDIAKRIPRYQNEMLCGVALPGEIEYTNAVKIKKKENIVPKVCFINQLRQIPGVSCTMAQVLSQEYHNMGDLIKSYQGNEKGDKMLKDIKVGNRKLGPVVSKRIYEYIFL